MAALHRQALASVADNETLNDPSQMMQNLVANADVADDMRTGLLSPTTWMGSDVSVAVRSSATGEDHGRDASFAGMNRTLTNVTGDDDLVSGRPGLRDVVIRPACPGHPASRGFTGEHAMAVVVQQMIASERSGVPFTADPNTGQREHVVVEAA